MRILRRGSLAVASHRTLVDSPKLTADAVVGQRFKSIVGPKLFLRHRPLPQSRLSLAVCNISLSFSFCSFFIFIGFAHSFPTILIYKIFFQPEALLACHYDCRIRHLGNCLVVKSGSIHPTLTAHILSLQQFACLPAYIQPHIKIKRRVGLVAHHSIHIATHIGYSTIIAWRNGIEKMFLRMRTHYVPVGRSTSSKQRSTIQNYQ